MYRNSRDGQGEDHEGSQVPSGLFVLTQPCSATQRKSERSPSDEDVASGGGANAPDFLFLVCSAYFAATLPLCGVCVGGSVPKVR